MGLDMLHENNIMINSNYKNMGKKVKSAAAPLPYIVRRQEKEFQKTCHFGSPWISDTFIEEFVMKLRIEGKGFLLPEEEN